ncbi:uncharacterized protein [Anser cygnoides]|uniref:uncharacterized protein isoform X2 n=1 Tax=Anser cygnoides TaxID=8845 RepID=UPI0034D167A6
MGRGAGQARVRSLELGPDVFVLQAVLGMGRGSQKRKGAACVVWGRDCEFTEWDALGRAGTSPPERGEAPGAEWRCNCAKELAGESAAFGHIQVGGLEPGRRSQ